MRAISFVSWILLGIFAFAHQASAQSATGGTSKSPLFMRVKIKITFKHRLSTRIRTKSFTAYRLRKQVRKILLQHGPARLRLKITTEPPANLSIVGFMQNQKAGILAPIRIKPGTLHVGYPQNLVYKVKRKNLKVKIEVKAGLKGSVHSAKKNAYEVDFKGVTLRRVFQKLAEFNNLSLSLDSKIGNVKRVNLKLKASSRKGLIKLVCKRFILRCRVVDKTLWVRP